MDILGFARCKNPETTTGDRKSSNSPVAYERVVVCQGQKGWQDAGKIKLGESDPSVTEHWKDNRKVLLLEKGWGWAERLQEAFSDSKIPGVSPLGLQSLLRLQSFRMWKPSPSHSCPDMICVVGDTTPLTEDKGTRIDKGQTLPEGDRGLQPRVVSPPTDTVTAGSHHCRELWEPQGLFPTDIALFPQF